MLSFLSPSFIKLYHNYSLSEEIIYLILGLSTLVEVLVVLNIDFFNYLWIRYHKDMMGPLEIKNQWWDFFSKDLVDGSEERAFAVFLLF